MVESIKHCLGVCEQNSMVYPCRWLDSQISQIGVIIFLGKIEEITKKCDKYSGF